MSFTRCTNFFSVSKWTEWAKEPLLQNTCGQGKVYTVIKWNAWIRHIDDIYEFLYFKDHPPPPHTPLQEEGIAFTNSRDHAALIQYDSMVGGSLCTDTYEHVYYIA